MLVESDYLIDTISYDEHDIIEDGDDDVVESNDKEHQNADINLEMNSSEHIKQDTGEENSNSSMNMSIFAIQMC